MRFVRGLAALVVCLAAGAGCGVDELVPTDAAVDAPPEIDAEEYVPPETTPLGPEHALRAIEVLDGIENRLPSLLVNGRFPEGTVASTPGATCCAAGGVTICPPNPGAWQIPRWEALGVSIDSPHAYVFSASSVGGYALTVVARGDLDCDGTASDLVMSCTLAGGVVTCQLLLPELLD